MFSTRYPRLPPGHSDAELLKVLFSLDIVNIVFGDVCRDINRFITRYCQKSVLIKKMEEVVEYLLPHLGLIEKIYGLIGSRLENIRGDNVELKRKLEFVNSLLEHTFDIKIILDRSDPKRESFCLKPSGKFRYVEETKSWRPRT